MIRVNSNARTINIVADMNIKNNIQKSLNEAAEIIKATLKAEMDSPKKSGTLNRKTGRRRSATGEGLATDSGQSAKLISSSGRINSVEVGFLSGNGDIVKEWEESNLGNRPTMKLAVEASLPKIEEIFIRNFSK